MIRSKRTRFILVLITLLTSVLLAADTPTTKKSTPDPLPVGSIWTGIESNDPRMAKRVDHKAKLKIIERDGTKFTADYNVAEPKNPRAVRLEGTIRSGLIEARVSKIIKGKWGGGAESVWDGRVEGNELTFVRKNEKQLDINTKLTLDTRKSGDADEKN